MIVYLEVVLEYEGIFIILISDSLVINIKCNLNRWCRRTGEGSSIRATTREGKVCHQRGVGSSNSTTGEGEVRRWRGEVISIRTA
jgi:hypothetical protein